MKNVLIACEESQTVCKEFRKLGINAFSCDIIECSGGHPEWHFKQDVLQVIKNKGGILETSSQDKSWEELKANYAVTSKDNSSITISVGGSTSVKSIVSALLLEFSSKCGGFKYNYNPTGSSDAYKRTNGSEKDGANYCDLAFLSREFKTEEALYEKLKGKMCIDAIVAVVNNKNNVSKVSAANLRDIYTGAITKWDEVK